MRTSATLAGLLLTLLLPASALAKSPTVSTGSATAIEQTTATVRGKVNPQGNTGVTAYFQYGGNKLYGSTTPPAPLSSASSAISTTAGLSGLSPYTTYHYRVVAQRGNAVVFGSDQTFKTDRQPLGLTLAASPDVIRSGDSSTLTGTLSGTDNAGKQVLLQSQAYGTPGFTDSGEPHVVDASGNFSFPLLSVAVNTAYRVVLPQKPDIVSPIVFITVPLKARLKVSAHVRRGKRLSFHGTVSPSSPGALVEIQKRFHGAYVTIGKTHVGSSGKSFKRRLKLYRSGTFRAVVTPQVDGQPGGPYTADTTGSHKIKVRRH